jgi:hypothetical protein
MSWNGKKLQTNFDWQYANANFMFLNHFLSSPDWYCLDNYTIFDPSKHDSDGYMHTLYGGFYGPATAGVYTSFQLPSSAQRSGNYAITWSGTGTISLGTTHTIVSSVPGRIVFTPGTTGQLLRVTAVGTDGSDYPTNIAVVHVDDEADYLSGIMFSPLFKNLFKDAFGALRFLNLQDINQSNLVKWADRRPLTYYSYSAISQFVPSKWLGTTSGTTDNYTISVPGGFSLVDKAQFHILFNVDGTGFSPVINVGGTGSKPLLSSGGETPLPFPEFRPSSIRLCMITYDEDLDGWLMHGGNSAYGSQGLQNGFPPEILVRLANELEAHPWFHIPYFAVDPLTDYTTELATYVRDNLDPALIPRFEVANEVWNFAAGFFHTRYASSKQAVVGSGSYHNWYGRASALVGEAVSDVYSGDRTKYQMMCAIQTISGTSDANPRMTENSASNWYTHVAVAGYHGGVNQSEHEADFRYHVDEFTAATTDAERAPHINWFMSPGNVLNDGPETNEGTVRTKIKTYWDNWKAWGISYGVTGFTQYEGGQELGVWTSDPDYIITGASKAAQCVLTMYSTPQFLAGDSLKCVSVGGMTQLNNNTYTVVSVDKVAKTITINVDSTGFSTYTSDGTAQLVGYKDLCTAYNAGVYYADANRVESLRANRIFVEMGGEFPSEYLFASDTVWGLLHPNLYQYTVAPRYKAAVAFNERTTFGFCV